jgi:ketosteroid isomerase-like protein
MGLLFRPRWPPSNLLTGAECFTSMAECEVIASTGGSVAELRQLSLARASERVTRAKAFSDLEFTFEAEVTDDRGYAEWVVTARHTRPFVLDLERVIDPTGRRVAVRGVTVAELSDDHVSSFRQYWDELALLECLGVLPRDGRPDLLA